MEGLPLAAATPATWLPAAVSDLNALLNDHAHCELKAASTAMSLAGRFADRGRLVLEMTALAREELRHFDLVHRLLRRRGGALTLVEPDRYVRRLKRMPMKRLPGSSALMDQLVLCAFIEARSCERFRLLAAAGLPDGLGDFYGRLADAEDRHHERFLSLAEAESGEAVVRRRVEEVAGFEASIVRELPAVPRIH